jgi:hypothetical protein
MLGLSKCSNKVMAREQSFKAENMYCEIEIERVKIIIISALIFSDLL